MKIAWQSNREKEGKKMDREFKFIHKEIHNCLDDCFASIARTWGRDYELMFLEGWNFEYTPIKNKGDLGLIGERVDPGRYMNWECLANYHGIGYRTYDNEDKKEQLKILETTSKNNNKIVIIELDGYYVPWTAVYKKAHRLHFCIAFGMNNEEGVIKCYDPFWNTHVNNLSIKNFYAGKGFCNVLTKKEYDSNIDWKLAIRKSLENLTGNGAGKDFTDLIFEFANDIENYINLYDELFECEENLFIAPMMMQMGELGNRRMGYSNSLIYLSKKYEVTAIEEFSEKIKTAGKRWLKARRFIMSAYENNDEKLYLSKAVDEIRKLAKFERKIQLGLEKVSQ